MTDKQEYISVDNKSKVDNFLEMQKQSLLDLRLEILETMDIRFASLLSRLGNQIPTQANVAPQTNHLGPPIMGNPLHYSQSQLMEPRRNIENQMMPMNVMNQEVAPPFHPRYNQQFPNLNQ